MLLYSSFLFVSVNLFSTFIILSSFSLLNIWIMLEINLISFIPILFNKKNQRQSESMMKYFLIQVIASSVVLFSFIWCWVSSYNSMEIIITLSMLLKLAMFPFHSWILEIMEGLSWTQNIMLTTWQKINPLYILSTLGNHNMILIFSIFSILTGAIMGMNQSLLRKLMACSSISHMGWTCSTMSLNFINWIYYFFIYSMLSISLISLMSSTNMYHFISLSKQPSKNIIMLISFLSLAGLPPLTGFLNKFIIVLMLMKISTVLTLMIIFFSLINLFFYMRLCLMSFMYFKSMTKSVKNYKNQNKFILIFMVLSNFMLFWSLP